jgi:outer membrane protein assembly factor BamB
MTARRPLHLILVMRLMSRGFAVDAYDQWQLIINGDATKRLVAGVQGTQVQRLLITIGTVSYIGYVANANTAQVTVDSRALQLGGLSVSGGMTGSGNLRKIGSASTDASFSVAIARQGNGLAGTLTLDGVAMQVTGAVLPGSAAAPVASEASWPQVAGAHGDYTASDQANPPQLVAALTDARLLWISQEVMSTSSAGSRYIGPPNGGSAGPILHQGRIFQYYYVPAGPIIDAGLAAERNPIPPPWNRTLADDVMVAIDAATGRTLWRTVSPLSGVTYAPHKTEMQGHTMVARGERVYAVGSAGMVYCLDAATGAIIWKKASPLNASLLSQVAQMAASGVRVTGYTRPDNRNSGHSPAMVGDVLVVPSVQGASIAGLDAADGTVLWTRSNVLADNAQPLAWRSPDGDRLIIAGLPQVVGTVTMHRVACINPRTGVDQWVSAALGPMTTGVTIHGDRLWANTGTALDGMDARLTCFTMTRSGLVQAWTAADAVSGGTFDKVPGSQAMLIGDTVYARAWPAQPGQFGLAALDAATGAVKKTTLLWGTANETTGVGMPGLLLWFSDWQHGSTSPVGFDMAGSSLGSFVLPSHIPSTPYQTPCAGSPIVFDGRWLVRGMDGLSCYDLRRLPTVPGNTPPVISNITDRAATEGGGPASASFTVGDAETAAGSLLVSATSSNIVLVPVQNIGFAGLIVLVVLTPPKSLPLPGLNQVEEQVAPQRGHASRSEHDDHRHPAADRASGFGSIRPASCYAVGAASGAAEHVAGAGVRAGAAAGRSIAG